MKYGEPIIWHEEHPDLPDLDAMFNKSYQQIALMYRVMGVRADERWRRRRWAKIYVEWIIDGIESGDEGRVNSYMRFMWRDSKVFVRAMFGQVYPEILSRAWGYLQVQTMVSLWDQRICARGNRAFIEPMNGSKGGAS